MKLVNLLDQHLNTQGPDVKYLFYPCWLLVWCTSPVKLTSCKITLNLII